MLINTQASMCNTDFWLICLGILTTVESKVKELMDPQAELSENKFENQFKPKC